MWGGSLPMWGASTFYVGGISPQVGGFHPRSPHAWANAWEPSRRRLGEAAVAQGLIGSLMPKVFQRVHGEPGPRLRPGVVSTPRHPHAAHCGKSPNREPRAAQQDHHRCQAGWPSAILMMWRIRARARVAPQLTAARRPRRDETHKASSGVSHTYPQGPRIHQVAQ